MIYKSWDQAYEWASKNAETFDAIDMLADGTFRVRLEGVPVDPLDVASTVQPEIPDWLEKIEMALAKIGRQDLPPEEKPWPPMSPFWRKVVARVYFFGKPEIICRVGRRGGKSSTICRIAVGESLYGDHRDSAGDRAYFAIISATRGQAQERLLTCAKILAALGIECKPTKELIDLPASNRGIRVFTASVQGVISFTSIGAMCDEAAYWKDEDSGSNPAKEVIGSLRPTTATQPNAKIWHISAPYSTFDEHYKMYEDGTNSRQTCFYGESWIANPSLTEQRTHDLEPDEVLWRCQYKAVPMPAEEDAFFPSDHIDAACLPDPYEWETGSLRRLAGGDFAFRRNSSALVCLKAGEDAVDRLPRMSVLSDREWVPLERSLRPGDVLTEAIAIAEGLKCDALCCDLHYIETVREYLEDTSIALTEYPSNKNGEIYVRFRVLLSQGRIDLRRASKKLIEQLRGVKGKPTAEGIQITNPTIKGAHGDIASALLCAAYEADVLRLGNEVAGGKRRFTHEPPGQESDWIEHSEDYDPD